MLGNDSVTPRASSAADENKPGVARVRTSMTRGWRFWTALWSSTSCGARRTSRSRLAGDRARALARGVDLVVDRLLLLPSPAPSKRHVRDNGLL